MESIGLFFVRGVNAIIPDRYTITTERVAKAMLVEAIEYQKSPGSGEPQVHILDNLQIAKISA